MQDILVALIIAFAGFTIIRGIDVRFVLLMSGLLLGTISGDILAIFNEFQRSMGEGKTIAPICAAMGYAFVLRATGCDKAMVYYIVKPLKKISWLLLPGSCFVGFLTNVAISSQTAAAAAVGPILIPILTAAGFHPIIAASALVLGSSGGGDLFNPGEPEVVSIQSGTGAPLPQVMDTLALFELTGFIIAVIVFTILSYTKPPQQQLAYEQKDSNEDIAPGILKAIMPPLPIITLLLVRPSIPLFAPLAQMYPNGLPVPHVMMFYGFLIIITHWKKISSLTSEFFAGLGYGYAHVISLIITANCFILGLEAVGIMKNIIDIVANSGGMAKVLSGSSVWLMAVISGSGTAPSVAFANGVLPTIAKIDIQHAIDLGALGAMGSAFGRTMSPAAAVMLFASALISTTPLEIVKRTSIPLIIGLASIIGLVVLFR